MKKIVSFLAVCAAAVGMSAVAADATYCPNYTPQTVVLKGTITDQFNYAVTTDTTVTTNCFAWSNDPRKLDVYIVLCYDAVDCTNCDITINDGYAFVVDKKAKTVAYGELTDDELDLICMGENNVGFGLDLSIVGYPSFVAAGKRDCKYGLLSFSGHYGQFDDSGINQEACSTANKVRAGSFSLRRDDSMTKKALSSTLTDKYCPECTEIPESCDKAMALLDAYISKTYTEAKGYSYIGW